MALAGTYFNYSGSVCLVPLTILIPLYKAGSHIQALWDALLPVLSSLSLKFSTERGGCEFESIEIIFVDDGSPEDEVEQLLALGESLTPGGGLTLRIIRLEHNCGQQAAVYCGLMHAKGERVLTMDDDLQHPPSFIQAFYEASSGYDLSYALPAVDDRSRQLKAGSALRDSFFRWVLSCPQQIRPGSFRIISRKTIEAIRGKAGSFVYVSALIFRNMPSIRVQNITYERSELPESRPEKEGGGSRFSSSQRALLFLRLFIHYALPRGSRDLKKIPYVIKDEL